MFPVTDEMKERFVIHLAQKVCMDLTDVNYQNVLNYINENNLVPVEIKDTRLAAQIMNKIRESS